MKWNKDKSLLLTQIFTLVFAIFLLAVDIGAYWITNWFLLHRLHHPYEALMMMITIYACSVYGWIFLFQFWGLLVNIKRGDIFIPDNVDRLRNVAWSCAGTAVVCAVASAYYLPFLFAALGATIATMTLRVVKNLFERAIAMKSELDLTV